jgi:hypothetical protein
VNIGSKFSSAMNEMGAQGWELVSASPVFLDHKWDNSLEAETFMFCSKRALP